MTEKLYYADSHMREFDAEVVSCEAASWDIYKVILTRTAFFPEGGGQAGDVGEINGVRVTDTHLSGGEVVHYCAAPLEPGEAVHGVIDWDVRFKRMQAHSAEHIVSGIVDRRFGFANVGFHMGEDGVIVDFDGFITDDELREIELEANRVVWQNRQVRTSFPTGDELSALHYRSKLDIRENVRIVEIEGVDICACCAPHVDRTGEVGIIRIFESIRRKDGVRIRMLAGEGAYLDAREKSASVAEISAMLSAKPNLVADAVRRVVKERDDALYSLGGARREAIAYKAAAIDEKTARALFFEPSYTAQDAKLLCEAAVKRTNGSAFTFFGAEGELRYCAIGTEDLRPFTKRMNEALRGRGGGSAGQVSGRVEASRQEIESFFGGVESEDK